MSVYFRTRYIKSVQLKPSSKYSDTVVALMMVMGWDGYSFSHNYPNCIHGQTDSKYRVLLKTS